MKTGIFGGTFDPPHLGHALVAEQALWQLNLDRILFMPASNPWMKDRGRITEVDNRVEMTVLATEGNDKFVVSRMEADRAGPTYTADTLRELREQGEEELYLIVGLDALAEISLWHTPKYIVEMATIVGYPRDGFEKIPARQLDAVKEGASREVVLLTGPTVSISSTRVRAYVSKGHSVEGLVPAAVEEYISEKGLYGGTDARS